MGFLSVCISAKYCWMGPASCKLSPRIYGSGEIRENTSGGARSGAGRERERARERERERERERKREDCGQLTHQW